MLTRGGGGRATRARIVLGVLIVLAVALAEASAQVPSVRFAVIGDYGLADTPTAAVAALVASWSPDFVVTTGDNNYYYGEASTIDRNIGQYYHAFIYPYRGHYGAGASVNRFFPVLGNHDWETPNAQPYLDYFTLPGNERYYDVVQGPVHIFALDSDDSEPDGVKQDSIQAQWLGARLAASSARWKVVVMHHPPYSSGHHGSTDWMQWPFAVWGAHAVLAGHDHLYERVTLGDFPYFVNGLGGASLYAFEASIPGSQVRYNADFGAMLVEASQERLDFQFVTRTGLLIDRYTLYASPEAHTPAAPSDLIATVVSGSEIQLGWRDNASNEGGFRLEEARGTEAFVPVATVAANVTTYAVSGLAPTTTYSYRAVALNAAGESPPSAPAIVQTLAAGPPPAPSLLTALAMSSSRIDLTWADNSANESGFVVEQAAAESTFSPVANLTRNVTRFSVTGLAPFVTYGFRVRAHNPDGGSYSNTVSLRTAFTDLVTTALSEPPTALTPGGHLTVASTVLNQGSVAARAFQLRFYVSTDRLRDAGDVRLSGGKNVNSLAPGASVVSTVSLTIPSTVTLGTYYVLACADDGGAISETDEINNCRASVNPLVVGRPDLVVSVVGDPPTPAVRGTAFTATDTVRNQGAASAPATKLRYYLSVDASKGSGDRLLSGTRSVPTLAPGATATGSVRVTIPKTTVPGDYRLFACADDAKGVVEIDETNNCRAAAGILRVTP